MDERELNKRYEDDLEHSDDEGLEEEEEEQPVYGCCGEHYNEDWGGYCPRCS